MKKIWLLLLLLAAAVAAAALLLPHITAQRYSVDYCGAKELFLKAKDRYRAGSTVTVYYPYVATDTDYTVLLCGEPIAYTYDDKHGFVITFTMPAHDVTLQVDYRNSMVYVDGVQDEN